MVNTILDFLIPWIWGFFIVSLVYSFIRTAWQHGIWVAIIRLFSAKILLPFFLVISLTILKVSLVFIYPQEVGVVVSVISKNGVREEPFHAGLHWIVPFLENVEIYPIYWQTYTMSSRPMEGERLGDDSIVTRTADGQEVVIDCSFVFVIDPENVIKLHINWQDRYIEDFIRPLIRAVTRTYISQYTVGEVNSDKRSEIQIGLEQTLMKVTQHSGIIFQKFFLRNIAFTAAYAESIEKKQMAEQGIIQKDYEAKQIENLAKGEAARIIIKAEAQAEAILIKAKAQAQARLIQAKAEAKALRLIEEVVENSPDILTYNYIDKLSPNLKAMLLPNNAPLILPLPQLDSDKTESDKTPASEKEVKASFPRKAPLKSAAPAENSSSSPKEKAKPELKATPVTQKNE
jgi:regulator of protease activity HflC (stomatin/prohibitin superfamily)